MYVPPPSSPGSLTDMRARLRPMGVGDILDETFRLYRENFMLFVATIAVLEVPAQILSVLIALAAPAPPTLTPGQTPSTAQLQKFFRDLAASSGGSGAGGLVIALVSVFITAVMAVVISNRYLNRTMTVGEAYRAAPDRFGSLLLAIIWIAARFIGLVIAAAIVIGIIVAVLVAAHLVWLAVLVGIILGLAALALLIYLGVAWSLFSQVIMLENVTGGAASGRSRELIGGYWWKALGLSIVVNILVSIVSGIPIAIVAAVSVGAGTSTRVLISGIIGLIIGVLVRPIPITASTLLFYDLKIRKEAFDLEAMVQQASTPPPTHY